MAITTATLTITSSDLLSNNLAIATSSTLTKAGTRTGLSETSGLARKTLSFSGSGVIDTSLLFRGDDYTTNGANKVYIKNTSTTDAEYFTIHIDAEEIGRLYAGDWCFFPWNANGGTKETFTCEVTNTWAAGDTVVFDGVTITAANSTVANIATQIDNAQFPNWVTSVSSATVTFVSRYSRNDLEIDSGEASGEIQFNTAGNGDLTIVTTVNGTKSISDIYVKPSVHTDVTLEYMLIHE